MLTGEYLVLHGAYALGLPSKFGQSLYINSDSPGSFIDWVTYVRGKSWFTATIRTEDLTITNANSAIIGFTLQKLLHAARVLSPIFLSEKLNYKVISKINFDVNWGIGSSSSLISNLAYWARIDPYELHDFVYDGSGYDVACARSDSPLIYKAGEFDRKADKVIFQPIFKNNLYFVYTGTKQSSEKSVAEFRSDYKPSMDDIKTVDTITERIVETSDFEEFNNLIRRHERLLAGILGRMSIKEERFSNFEGEVKSLGAWGGDFILASSDKGTEYVTQYFNKKSMETVFSFDDFILANNKDD